MIVRLLRRNGGGGEDEERGSLTGDEARERGGLPLVEDWMEEAEDRGERSFGREEGMKLKVGPLPLGIIFPSFVGSVEWKCMP